MVSGSFHAHLYVVCFQLLIACVPPHLVVRETGIVCIAQTKLEITIHDILLNLVQ